MAIKTQPYRFANFQYFDFINSDLEVKNETNYLAYFANKTRDFVRKKISMQLKSFEVSKVVGFILWAINIIRYINYY